MRKTRHYYQLNDTEKTQDKVVGMHLKPDLEKKNCLFSYFLIEVV